MPHQIVITDEDISYAEEILLPEGETFDPERIVFIKNLDTVDLQACPGSGKTTCLLAKLLILGRHTSVDQTGILVLSHTNAAINEMKDKLFRYAPELFTYPNFIGTIQSFVDYFFAVPFYNHKYGYQPIRIDDEIFNEKIWEPSVAKGWLDHQPDKIDFLRNLRFDINGNLVTGVDGESGKFRLIHKTTEVYRALLEMRKKLMEDGYLCFDDGYYLAETYIRYYPKIIDYIKLRFGFVFIDEMQDTDVHQIGILDKVFPSGCNTVVQRIGDQNQAIYGRKVKSSAIWIPKNGFLSINGSKRLSIFTAETVKNISLSPQDLVGNSTRTNIKPKMILFNNATIKKVIPRFAEIIVENNLHTKENTIFKAIGWRKSISDNGGKGIESYLDCFQQISKKNRIDFDFIVDYINCNYEDIKNNGCNVLRQNILNAINKTLRIAGIFKQNGKSYTSQSFLTFLTESHPDEYETLKDKLFNWSLNICNGLNIKNDVVVYIKHLLQDIFSITELSKGLSTYLTGSGDQTESTNIISIPDQRNQLCYKIGETEIKIEVTTIHSVKGETHTATLYLETYYFNDSGKSYESQRLFNQLKGNRVEGTVGKRVQESQKMAYVGMTRPTDLLCFAVNCSNIPVNEVDNLRNKWDIIELSC